MQTQGKSGPLAGLRVVEFAGIGPGPFAGMMLADMGAEVVVIERSGEANPLRSAGCHRGKRSIGLNLKRAGAIEVARRLIERADALIEGYRPGVMERLGLGPEEALARNPRLIYGRMTGWGQTGPLANAAGHDLNYVALGGALSISRRGRELPSVPATLVGDMGGGAMYLAFGMVCALLEARKSGRGQVVDAAVVDGVASLFTLVQDLRASGYWRDEPERNLFLGSSPFYDVFECADGKHVTLGAIEPQFYRELLDRIGLADEDPGRQLDPAAWPDLRARIAGILRTRTRAQWCAALEGTDACFAPVLDLAEAPRHPHHVARGNYFEIEGRTLPAPAPKFSRTAPALPASLPRAGEHSEQILGECGFDDEAIARMRADGAWG